MSNKLKQMADEYQKTVRASDDDHTRAFMAGAKAALELPEVVAMREALIALRFFSIIDPNTCLAIAAAREALQAFDKLKESL